MKRRIWTALPVYIIFVVMMIPMSVITFYYNKILGIIEASLTMIALAAVLAMVLRFRAYIRSVVAGALELSFSPDDKALEALKIPVVICGENGEILSYNSRFRKQFLDNYDGENLAIQPFLSDHQPDYAIRSGSVDVRYGDKLLLLVTGPFNLLKGVVLSIVTGLIYKPLSPILHGKMR